MIAYASKHSKIENNIKKYLNLFENLYSQELDVDFFMIYIYCLHLHIITI